MPALLGVSVALSMTTGAGARPITRDQLLALQQRFFEAAALNDVKAADTLMSKDAIYVHGVGLSNDKPAQLAMMAKAGGPAAWVRVETQDTRVSLHPAYAMITQEAVFARPAPAAGQPPAARRPYRLTTVWGDENGTWRLLLWHGTVVTVGQP